MHSLNVKSTFRLHLFKLEFLMQNVTPTAYGNLVQTCQLLGLPLTVASSSTLNEKLGIQSGVAIPAGSMPSMRYIAIGNGGHKFITAANGRTKSEEVSHQPTDASLFNFLPFVLRTLDNDIPAATRTMYALRRIETHNSVQYIAYYLKRMDFSGVVPQMEYKTVTNNVTSTTPFVPNISNLNPTPAVLSNTGVNVTTGDYVAATAKIPFLLSTAEVAEILNVASIIEGDEGFAIISEIALCTGVDKVVTASAGNLGSFNFSEAVGVQVTTFINSYYPLKSANGGINVLLDVGATRPLLTLTPA
jgi:hypothetical protein